MRTCRNYLEVRVSQSIHHFLASVGTRSVTLTADDLVLGGKTQFSSEVVFSLGTARVDLLLDLAVTEESKDEGLVLLNLFFGLGLQFADEELAALQGVHGPDEGEEGVLVG